MVVVVGSGKPETLMDSMNDFRPLSTKFEGNPFSRKDSHNRYKEFKKSMRSKLTKEE